MDVSKNDLVSNDFLMEELREDERKNYTKVPKHLERAARKKLAGMKRATVSFTSGGKLSRWAAKQREARKKVIMSGKENYYVRKGE